MAARDKKVMVWELGGRGYTCANVLLVGALYLMGVRDKALVRNMSGLTKGLSNSGQLCGALAGGMCLLSMYATKDYVTKDYAQKAPMKEEALLHEALGDWFKQRVCMDYPTCDDILDLQNMVVEERIRDARLCGVLIMNVWDECMFLLEKYGIDPKIPRR